jgi:ABC-2 type transport system permease protein
MRNVWLVFRKDLLVLWRSPLLLSVLLLYPIVIALLIGLTAGYANTKPRVGLVDRDNLPDRITIANRTFYVDRTIEAVSRNVRLQRMDRDEAARQLRSGRLVAVITIPPGFLATLQGLVRSPTLELETATGGVAPRVRQQMQALVYELNRRLQRAFIAADIEYVNLLLHGGRGKVLGNEFEVLGLDGMDRILKDLPRGKRLDELREFSQDARLALGLTDDAIRATATPIKLVQTTRGRTATLSAQVQAYALGLTLAFLTLLLAAGALAAERDENVIGRLARGLVGLGELVWAKVALAAAVALAVGGAIALAFGVIIEAGGVEGGEPWVRLPLLAAGLLLAGAALGALGAFLGALSREARTASLVALLVVLPVVFLGLTPREVVPPAGWISDAFPFSHAVRFFASSLYDTDPWPAILREALWLAGLGVLFGLLARGAARRLVA